MVGRDGEVDLLRSRALENPELYWSEVADKLVWSKKWNRVFDGSKSPFFKWFLGGEINLCYNCVDRHVEEGFGERTAFIFYSPVTNTHKEYTFNHILDQVSRLAGVLLKHGLKKGDMVLIYMPVTPEAVFAMLACARLGATSVCVPSGLPAKDLSLRIDHCKAKVIIASSYGFHPVGWVNYKDQLDNALNGSKHKPLKVVVFQRDIKDPVSMTPGRDLDWKEEIKSSERPSCVPVEANEPALMIYTSGSTAAPKAIVHAVGRYTVRMKNDIPLVFGRWDDEDEEVVFMPSNIGWIAGQSLVVYGPLLEKIKTVIFEGDPLLMNDVHTLYKLIQDCNVTRPIIRPGILKLLKGKDPDGKVAAQYNLKKVKMMFVGGERTDKTSMKWATKTFGVNIFNGYGQSESSALFNGIPDVDIPKSLGRVFESTRITPGWDVVIMKPDNTIAKPNEVGRILVRLPLPPGSLLTIFENSEQFLKNYFTEYPGYFDTKDEGVLESNGRLKCECRTDDIMKVGLIYLAAQELEDVIAAHPAILQCVVVSFPDLIWKEMPVVLYIPRSECKQTPDEISRSLEDLVKQEFGTSVKLGGAVAVKELPRTRTGKVHRPSCNQIIRGKPVTNTGAVENPQVFDDISRAVKEGGFGRDVLLD